jgi:hypothetical protein
MALKKTPVLACAVGRKEYKKTVDRVDDNGTVVRCVDIDFNIKSEKDSFNRNSGVTTQ